MTIYLPTLSANENHFPALREALTDPDGLLAMGGDLKPQRIIKAYKKGIFPWFSDGQPILWWSPSKRALITPNRCHISKSMNRLLRKNSFNVTVNHAFAEVIEQCAQPRASQPGTWINKAMIAAYIELHQQGEAHSIEVWQNKKIVGGLYGVSIGSLFCGESMFSRVDNSSKIAFIALNQHLSRFRGTLIDCQIQSPHLNSLGVKEVSRASFMTYLQRCRGQKINQLCWQPQQILVEEKTT